MNSGNIVATNHKRDARLQNSVPSGWNSTRERVDGLVQVTPKLQSGTPYTRGTIYPFADGATGMTVTITVMNSDGLFDKTNQIQSSTHGSNKYVEVSNTIRTYYFSDCDSTNPSFWVYNYPITILGVGIYTAEDWTVVQQYYEEGKLEYPFFCGDTLFY